MLDLLLDDLLILFLVDSLDEVLDDRGTSVLQG